MSLDPAQALAEAFGRYVRGWAQHRGAAARVGDLVYRAAACVSNATSAGHVCLMLRDVARAVDADGAMSITVGSLRAALLESGVVGSPQEPGAMPLILDDGDRLYLHRYFDYENRLARCLAQRLAIEGAPGAQAGGVARGMRHDGRAGEALPTGVVPLFDSLFEATAQAPGPAVDWQKIAVLKALSGNLTIVSGGPGTGKTTAIVNLLACLLEENPDCRIALAAPTGKAAAGMTATIRRRAAHLPARLAAMLPQTSFTVHRLLEVLPEGGFRHHAGNPLPIDVLIVDEASMLDLALATQLVEAVPMNARIVLVGDKDQLSAVESGAVFAQLCADPGAGSGLQDRVVRLTQNYRFAGDSAIGRLAAEITAGDAQAALARLKAKDPSLIWIDDGAAVLSKDSVGALLSRYGHYLEAMGNSMRNEVQCPDPALAAAAFGRFRALCAVRDGLRGTHAINRSVSAWFRRELNHPQDPGAASDWYPGRPVIVLRNDYVLKLFNGDVGIVLPDAGGNLMVYFPDPDSGYRAIAPVRLPEHETAFAMTVHKAQGSEFDEALILLPNEPNRVLTRELLYTGVTRARERVLVMGGTDVVQSTILTATERVSGLAARMQDAAQAAQGA
jgi:exodeoxyribonuclease V alpha subunit